MAYRKPGVELTYVQRTLSPNIPTPIFYPVVIGEGYFVATVAKPTNLDEVTAITVSGTTSNPSGVGYLPQYSGMTYTASGGAAWTMSGSTYGFGQPVGAGTTLDPNSVVIDLYGGSKVATQDNAGHIFHLKSPTHFSVAAAGDTVSISGAAAVSALAGWVGSYVRMGYRLKRTDIVNRLIEYTSVDDIINNCGKPCVENPLGLGIYIAMLNAGTSVYGLAISGSINNTAPEPHSTACDVIAGQEVYTIAPISTRATVEDVYLGNIQTWARPENKHERLLFFCPQPRGVTNQLGSTSLDKSTFSTEVKISAMDKAERRLFRVFPPVCYVEEEKHLSTMYSGYVKNVWSDWSTFGYIAPKLTTNITLTNGTKYFKGQELTDTMLDTIAADGGYDYITVRYPTFGSQITAGLAGTVAGVNPEQGLTNAALLGPITELKYSSDYFSETHLDKMAEGGNWIMVQRGLNGTIKTRHQLSTDMTSVERRELSITKSLDYTGMTVRSAFEPYIGKFNITPDFLQKMGIILNGCKLVLQREGVLSDLRLESIQQDTVNRDTILVSLFAMPYYPANYIKITLAF